MFFLGNPQPRGRRLGRSRKAFRLNLESLEVRLAPSATYYVSPSGLDGRDGLSPQNAWRTIGRVNAQNIQPGDTVLFEGGATFSGSMEIYHGNPAAPKTFSSYGNGRATIASGNGRAMWANGEGGYHIRNLNFVGSGVATNRSGGLELSNMHVWNGPGANFVIEDVDVSGYGSWGIDIRTDPVYGISGIRLERITVHDNADGIYVGNSGAVNARLISDLYVGGIDAHHNDSHYALVSGYGIALANIANGTVERNLIHENGLFSDVNGHCAMIIMASSNLTVQSNEAWGHGDANGADGQAFALVGVSDVVVQYNYSHDNAGSSFDLRNEPDQAPTARVTVRYNISENDTVGISVMDGVSDTRIYNNTIFSGRGAGFKTPLSIAYWYGSGVHFRNNIFYAEGDNPAFMIDQAAAEPGRDLVFQNNVYYTPHTHYTYDTYIIYGRNYYTNLADFQQATGQELLFGWIPLGYTFDPRLTAPGQGGTVGNPDELANLAAYQLQAGSVLAGWGLDLEYFEIERGGRDFYGNGLPNQVDISVGAHQAPVEFARSGPAPQDASPAEEEAAAVAETLDAFALGSLTVHEGHARWNGPRFFSPVAIV